MEFTNRKKIVPRIAVGLLAIVVALPSCASLARAQISAPADPPFDRPLRTQVVDLGLTATYEAMPNVHRTLTCYYYPHFVVKELDLRAKGATWDAIVPVRGDAAPKCEEAKADGEIRVQDWGGYFAGVVGGFVLLNAADGLNASLAFRVVDAQSGRTLFEDEAKWQGQWLRIKRQPNGAPVLAYTRGYFADCPLPKGGTACWDKIRAATGLKEPSAPACTGLFKEYPDDPSVIFYPVRVVLGPKPESTPVPGRVRCEAQE